MQQKKRKKEKKKNTGHSLPSGTQGYPEKALCGRLLKVSLQTKDLPCPESSAQNIEIFIAGFIPRANLSASLGGPGGHPLSTRRPPREGTVKHSLPHPRNNKLRGLILASMSWTYLDQLQKAPSLD